jgi:hypothetical protein
LMNQSPIQSELISSVQSSNNGNADAAVADDDSFLGPSFVIAIKLATRTLVLPPM